MKVIILLSSISLAAQLDPPPRSVNVALETSFLFDPKDINENKLLVNNIKGFLDKLYKILEPAQKEKYFKAEAERQGNEGSPNFMEVLKNIGTHFVSMPGGNIKEALHTIHGEVTKIADNKKGQAKIKEIIPNEKLKTMIKDSINDWMKSNPEEMRRTINSTMTEDSPLLKTFAKKVNTLYNDEDIKKLNKISKKFRRNIENGIDNSKVIKELVHNAIFKKYNSLNESTKEALLSDLKTFSGFLIVKNMFSGLNENLSVLAKRNPPIQEDDTVGFNETDMTYTALRKSIDKKLRDTREKKVEKIDVKKDGAGSQINVEILVETPKKL